MRASTFGIQHEHWGVARRMVLFGAVLLVVSIATASCKIKRIEDIQAEAAAGDQTFDATRYVSENWESKVLPYFEFDAHPLPEVLAAIRADIDAAGGKFGHRAATEGAAWNFIIQGTGTVAAKDTSSRAGKLVVSPDGDPPGQQIVLQIGPVVRGTAIRDSLPFISFQQFTNQLEFADVSKALIARSLEQVGSSLGAVDAGSRIAFIGAMAVNSASDAIVITPVALTKEPGPAS